MLPEKFVNPVIAEPEAQDEQPTVLDWMVKIDKNIRLLQDSTIAVNKAIERCYEELITLRNDVDDLKRR
jgi:hypothetical protein